MFTPNRIGTPLSPSATTVMLLGSGELGKEMAIAFQRLGVEVHAVDSYENAPAHQVAHAHYVIDMTNPDELRRLIAEVKPQFIVPEIEAVDTNVLDDCEAHGVTVIPTARATQLTMNREGIRRLAAEELGLPTSAYSFASNPLEFKQAVAAMGFPCVVKPVMSSSGKGQSIVRDDDDIAAAWDYAQSGGRVEGGRVIVERFVDFDYEITLLTVRSIDPRSGKTATWFCEPIGHLQRDGDYVESWQPIPMPSIALENARSVAARITNDSSAWNYSSPETTSTSPKSRPAPTTLAWSLWPPSASPNSSSTPAPSSVCLSTSRSPRPVRLPSSTVVSTPQGSRSTVWPRPSPLKKPTSGSLENPSLTQHAAWASPSPPQKTQKRHETAHNARPPQSQCSR